MSIPDINQNITSKISDANLVIINFPSYFFIKSYFSSIPIIYSQARSLVDLVSIPKY